MLACGERGRQLFFPADEATERYFEALASPP
jgi:hypothetical protein